jgi:death-on-curing protein
LDERLKVDEVRRIVKSVAEVFEQEYGAEPMPPFETLDASKLDAALAASFQSAFGEDIYATPYLKAAALFYFVAKDHPLENGNKRTAVIVLLYYLAKNGLALGGPARDLYELAKAVVESPRTKEEIIPELAKTLEKLCLSFDEWVKG